MSKWGIRRPIVSLEFYHLSSAPRGTGSYRLVLSCGHEKHCKASKVPKHHAFCFECRSQSERR